jgi:hypothetical protein
MAVPRPILLALLGTLLFAVTFMATMTSRDKVADQAQAPALSQQPAPAPTAPKQAVLAPLDTAKAIFAPGTPIQSARFAIRLTAQELGGKRERQAVRLAGTFQSAQPGKLPSFDIKTSEVERGKATHDHVLSTGDKGYLFNGATAFGLNKRSMAGVGAFREAIAKGTSGATGQVVEPDPASWLKNVKSGKTVKIDGVETSHVSAVIDPKLASANVRNVVKSIAGSADQPVNLPNRLNTKVKKALKSARLEAWVGTEDHILRRMVIDVRGTFPPELLGRGESARWQMGLDVNLSQVNKPQKIGTPPIVDPRAASKGMGAKDARSASGVFVLGSIFTDPPASIVKTTTAVLGTSQQERAKRKPRAVSRAVARHKKVVIYFHQAGGLDDSITHGSVVALGKRKSALVFEDSVANVASYGQVVMSVGVTRAPSIVIIGKSGRARLLEGYIDAGALAQEVADTR